MSRIFTLVGWMLFLIIFDILPTFARTADHVPGQILLQLRSDAKAWSLRDGLLLPDGRAVPLKIGKNLAPSMNIWSVRFDYQQFDERIVLRALQRHPSVSIAQFNHVIKARETVPNDPRYDQQLHLANPEGADLNIEKAWDLTTGGVTVGGDTIVIAVLDDGHDLGHEDFNGNLWLNRGEIPDNGQDDDNNGYIDDYRGWNVIDETDDIDEGTNDHGTPISGIIGARGDNNLGVAGINWNVKIMVLYVGDSRIFEANVIEAYAYTLEQRRRYNATNGAEGAFVVSSNFSFGIPFTFPDETPLWCAIYDELGAAGILNVSAGPNENVNADEEGDIPTNCGSDYLLAVTALNAKGEKVPNAGFGPENVDLGAFGESVFTTDFDNAYNNFPGTSGAAPQVAGTIGLLYAAPCSNLIALSQSDPAAAALLARRFILEGAAPTGSLQDITVTGGRLNVFNSLQILLDECGSCPPATSLRATSITDAEATLNWIVNDSIRRVDLRWRMVGADGWNEMPNVQSPTSLSALQACTEYEFQLRQYCNSDTLAYGASTTFKTDGCCEPPAGFSIQFAGANSGVVRWESLLAASSYRLQWRPLGNDNWRSRTQQDTLGFLNGLSSCTVYELRVQTICQADTTAFSPVIELRTRGCGACLDLDYCLPTNGNSDTEWIAQVRFHTLENASGTDDGYGDYTNIPSTVVVPGSTYQIQLRPGFAEQDFLEYFLAWIDLNQNGAFEASEQVFDPGNASETTVNGSVTIPPETLLGNTRLRIVMQFRTPGSACKLTGDAFGEIEDYCITLAEAETACPEAGPLDTLLIENRTAQLQWPAAEADAYWLRYRAVGNDDWQLISVADTNQLVLEGLVPCQEYEAQLKLACGNNSGLFGPALRFKTDCTTSVTPINVNIETFEIYPNPFRETLQLEITLRSGQSRAELELFDLAGRQLERKELELPAGPQNLSLSTASLPTGLYFIRLRLDDGSKVVRKVVKVR